MSILIILITFFTFCCGKDGADGQNVADRRESEDGKDAVQRRFYFQQGFKGYSGTEDNYLDSEAPSDNNGDSEILYMLQKWDEGLRSSSSDLAFPNIRNNLIIRFNDIDDVILAELDDPNTASCREDFYVNEAVLYLYAQLAASSFNSNNFSLRVSFFDESAPVWQENTSSWTSPNGTQPWDGANSPALCDTWTDIDGDYAVAIPLKKSPPYTMGWVGIPIPGQVIKRWICNSGNFNNGLRLRLSNTFTTLDEDGNAAEIWFMSSESSSENLRPLLYINAEPALIHTIGRKAEVSWEKYLEEWSNLPKDVQLRPLENRE